MMLSSTKWNAAFAINSAGIWRTELKPLTEQLENQEILPFPLHQEDGFRSWTGSRRGLARKDRWREEREWVVYQYRTRGRRGNDGRVVAFAGNQLTIEMSRVNPGLCSSWGVSVGLCAGNIRKHGTPEQIQKYVPSVLRGDKIGCWCLTEPGAGSDAFAFDAHDGEEGW